ncbi:MAG: PEP-CTERM sorting domain-containing protein [Gemmataceae bacterium]|nr:PEP-CTERM sorting domain-containing protein [Gemmataceae bacterium]
MFRKSVLFTAIVVLAFGAHARADVISFDPDGGGATGTLSVAIFDFSPGNVLADNSVPIPKSPTTNTFNVFYQARLSTLNNALNVPIFAPNLNGFEITAVMRFREDGTSPSPLNATFTGNPNLTLDRVQLFYDSSQNSNDATGMGFNDGTLFFQATIDQSTGNFTIDNDGQGGPVVVNPFAPNNSISTVKGTGSATADALDLQNDPNFIANSAFFPNPNQLLQSLNFNGNLVTPFSINASSFFNGADNSGTPQLGNVNGFTGAQGGGPDFQFQADANLTFKVLQVEIPEPASILLFGFAIGGVGLARAMARRRKATA